MPTLEALYRQDPESLPFRQPVDPQLLGIPVRIRTSNKTNLVRACAGTHYATKNLALFSSSLIVIIILPLPPLFLSSACCCVHCVWMWERHRKLASVRKRVNIRQRRLWTSVLVFSSCQNIDRTWLDRIQIRLWLFWNENPELMCWAIFFDQLKNTTLTQPMVFGEFGMCLANNYFLFIYFLN